MRFAQPEFLWALAALPVLGAVAWWALWRRRRALARFAGDAEFVKRFTGDVSHHRRFAKGLLIGGALVCVILALSRPQWGSRMEPIRGVGVDVVIALDTSLSMAAEDVAPSRLGLARHSIGSLLDKLGGNRVALVTFAGDATIVCPLTPDHSAVRLLLDTVELETVQVPGTSLAAALRVAARAFGEDPGDDRGRALVLFSDGEDHLGAFEQTRNLLDQAGVVVFAVGTGSERGGPIPLRTDSGRLQGYKKDRQDKVVTTRLDETPLRDLARVTDGAYYQATPSEREVEEIARALTGLEQGETATLLRRRYEERFQWPLALGIVMLVAEAMIGDRRRNRDVGSETLNEVAS